MIGCDFGSLAPLSRICENSIVSIAYVSHVKSFALSSGARLLLRVDRLLEESRGSRTVSRSSILSPSSSRRSATLLSSSMGFVVRVEKLLSRL